MEEIPDTTINLDPVDERVYDYQSVFGSETRSMPNPTFDIQNQGAEAFTKMACSRFGLVHIVNAQNSIVSKLTGNSPYRLHFGRDWWKEYLEENPSAQYD